MAGFTSIGAFVLDERGNLDMGEDLWSVSFGVFSDTVVLWPRRLVGSLTDVCRVVAFLIDSAMLGDWLFRGAIEFGSFRALPEHNVYLGKGLVDAHRLEMSQDWCGAIIGAQAEEKYAVEVAEMKRKHLLVDYAVPIKSGRGVIHKQCTTVNWCYYAVSRQPGRRARLVKLLAEAPEAAKPKLHETIAFHDQMVKAGLASLEQITGPVFGDPTVARS